jgi:hypothetical protein
MPLSDAPLCCPSLGYRRSAFLASYGKMAVFKRKTVDCTSNMLLTRRKYY